MAKQSSRTRKSSARAEKVLKKQPGTPKTFRRGKSKSGKDQETQHIATGPDGIGAASSSISAQETLRKNITTLTKQAEAGDCLALMELLLTAALSTSALHEIQIGNPTVLKPLLAECPAWPSIVSNNDKANQLLIGSLRELGFGSNASLGNAALYFARTPTSASSIASLLLSVLDACRSIIHQRRTTGASLELANIKGNKKAANALKQSALQSYRTTKSALNRQLKPWNKTFSDEQFESLIEQCSKLAPLSEKSWKEWFAVARKVFMDLTDGRPEESPDLQKLGGLFFDSRTKQFRFENDVYQPSKQRGIVRDKIVSSIRYAFRAKVVQGAKASSK